MRRWSPSMPGSARSSSAPDRARAPRRRRASAASRPRRPARRSRRPSAWAPARASPASHPPGEERMARIVVGLDLVGHPERRQVALQARGHLRPDDAILRAVAGHDRTDPVELRAVGGHDAVVDRGGREAQLRAGDEREAAALAEARHGDPPRVHLWPRRQRLAGRMDVGDLPRHAAAGHVEHHAGEAHDARAVRVEVGGQRRVAGLGEAARDAADVVVEAEGLVQHDHARVGSRAGGREQLGGKARAVGQRDLQPFCALRHGAGR